jgi:hypothetical protein
MYKYDIYSWRVGLFLALALAIVPGRAGQGQTASSAAEPVPRIAQTPQSLTAPTMREPAGAFAMPPVGAPVAPPVGAPLPPAATAAMAEAMEPAFGGTQFAALGGTGAAVAYNQMIGGLGGYIDSAIPRSNVRVRYDDAYGNNRPDRAEYFYPQCGCFFAGNSSSLPLGTRNAALQRFGPAKPEKNVDYQELSTYVEYAPRYNMSAFVEVPVRFINPTVNRNAYGFSDMILGFKYAFLADPDFFYTFQFKTYVPTGAGNLGLGTNHPSLEPGILAFQRVSERVYFLGEFRDWIPIRGTEFVGPPQNGAVAGKSYAGNILNYGLGVFYNAVLTDNFRVAPISEFVGWTCLGGLESTQYAPGIRSATGDTIVNMKIGVRFGLGDYNLPGGGSQLNDRASLYVGYARALTGDVWYQNMFRLEAIWYY